MDRFTVETYKLSTSSSPEGKAIGKHGCGKGIQLSHLPAMWSQASFLTSLLYDGVDITANLADCGGELRGLEKCLLQSKCF